MPCSCKANKSVQYKQPTSQVIYTKKPAVSYNFDSTTRPDQYCVMCIIKHLSIVTSLLQFSNPLSYVVAAGQLFLVFKHLYNMNKQKASFFYYLAMDMIQNPDRRLAVDFDAVIMDFVQDKPLTVDKDLPEPRIREDYKQYYTMSDALLALSSAYSLMFTQPTYERINKIYAIGDLSTTILTLIKNNFPVEVTRKIRECWKLLQQVTGQYTDDYFKCKKQMQSLLSYTYHIYLKKLKEKQHSQQ